MPARTRADASAASGEPPSRPAPRSWASTSSRSSASARPSPSSASRFSNRVLTPAEQRYVRDRPETMAGRWAAKEAVSKVLGLGVRGIGWRDIEVERLPTGPAVRSASTAGPRPAPSSSGWAASRSRSATSPTTRSRSRTASGTTGGRFLFPPDIEERLDDRERRILARIERLRDLAEAGGAAALAERRAAGGASARRSMAEPGPSASARARSRSRARRPGRRPRCRTARSSSTTRSPGRCCPARPARGHKGSFGKLLVIAGSLDYAGRRAARLPCGRPGRCRAS